MGLDFYLIRHGESEVNANPIYKRIYTGRNNWSRLTSRGIEQAKALGKELFNINFLTYYSSPAIRAQQTANHFLQEKNLSLSKVHIIEQLNELSQGSLEGTLKPDKTNLKIADYWTYIPQGGEESQERVYERASRFIYKELFKFNQFFDSAKLALFTHENWIKCLLAGLGVISKEEAHTMKIQNCSVILLQVSCITRKLLQVSQVYPQQRLLKDICQ